MTTSKVVTIASIAGTLLFSAAVFSAEPNSVPGEKLDSGLGDLSPRYAAIEFQRPAVTSSYAVLGEKLDSGLGDLSPSYTAAEFQRTETQTNPAGNHVLGEKLDSGLGDLSPRYSATEFQRPAVTSSHAVLGEKLDSGLGELTRHQLNETVGSR